MADIFRDIADSLSTSVGQSVCEAQEEVLHTCDQLYLANKISENQLLFLRHLVLIRDESVAAIYDRYQEGPSNNISQLARDLYLLVSNSPRTDTSTAAQVSAGDLEDDDDDDEDMEEDSPDFSEAVRQRDSDRAVMNAIRNDRQNVPNLTSIVTSMIKNKELSASEGAVLIQCVKAKNQYVLAAYELYVQDGDSNEFKDTLKRYERMRLGMFSCCDACLCVCVSPDALRWRFDALLHFKRKKR